MIMQLQKQWGNKWAAIAKVMLAAICDQQTLQNRTPNDVKSRYKSLSKQKGNSYPVCRQTNDYSNT